MTKDNDWRARQFVPIKTAAEIAGLSAATLYRAQAAGRVVFKRLAGRVLVPTESLAAFLDAAEPWSPSTAGAAARASRASRAAAAWAD